ncbi:hypothetical protein MJH12_13475, partial [bacterium]|nr:hypothetical protein [bacterium]
LSIADTKMLLNLKNRKLPAKPGSKGFFDSLNVNAIIQLVANSQFQWKGKVSRIKESLDPASRTVGLVVEVKNPYDMKNLHIKPPLLHGMYVHVNLSSTIPRKGFLVPKVALQGNQIFTISNDNTLHRQKIDHFIDQKQWVILSGLRNNLFVIISDIYPAIEGTKINYIIDQKLQNGLKLRILGENK